MSPERADYVQANAVEIVGELEAKIERQKEQITKLESSRAELRAENARLREDAARLARLTGYYIRRIAEDYTYYHSFGSFMTEIFEGSEYKTEAHARENIKLLEQSDRIHNRTKAEYDVVAVIELDREKQDQEREAITGGRNDREGGSHE